MKKMIEEQCSNCRYHWWDEKHNNSRCRKNPPIYHNSFVCTKEDWWCGEYVEARQETPTWVCSECNEAMSENSLFRGELVCSTGCLHKNAIRKKVMTEKEFVDFCLENAEHVYFCVKKKG